MHKNIYTVYKVTNKVNSKIYIGYTKFTAEERWKDHVGNRNVKNYHLSCAIRKYGADSFAIETLWQSRSSKAAKDTEKLLIAEYKSHLRDVGYNLTMGGEGESKTPEVRERIAETNRGQKRSAEAIQKMSKKKKGIIYEEKNLRLMLELKEKGCSYHEIAEHFFLVGVSSVSGKPISISVIRNAFKRLISEEVSLEDYSIERLKHIEEVSLKAAEKKVEENHKNPERISSGRTRVHSPEILSKIWEMHLSGMNKTQIANWVNEQGILNAHGNPYRPNNFCHIFKNVREGKLSLVG